MLAVSVVLLVLAALFLIAELHIPGVTPCGFIGGGLFLGSAVVTVATEPYGWLIVCAEAVALGALAVGLLRYIRKRQWYGKLILDETLAFEATEMGNPEMLLGKEGVTKTALKPFGKVDFNGTTLEVFADEAYIPERKKVRVVESAKGKILVRPVQ
jgi:membrane-bound serine protease (ClpP class)